MYVTSVCLFQCVLRFVFVSVAAVGRFYHAGGVIVQSFTKVPLGYYKVFCGSIKFGGILRFNCIRPFWAFFPGLDGGSGDLASNVISTLTGVISSFKYNYPNNNPRYKVP